MLCSSQKDVEQNYPETWCVYTAFPKYSQNPMPPCLQSSQEQWPHWKMHRILSLSIIDLESERIHGSRCCNPIIYTPVDAEGLASAKILGIVQCPKGIWPWKSKRRSLPWIITLLQPLKWNITFWAVFKLQECPKKESQMPKELKHWCSPFDLRITSCLKTLSQTFMSCKCLCDWNVALKETDSPKFMQLVTRGSFNWCGHVISTIRLWSVGSNTAPEGHLSTE